MVEFEWFEALFATIDRMDSDGLVSFLTDDASFTYGSQPAVHGKEAIRGFVSEFLESLNGIGHTLSRTWVVGDTRICEGDVTYDLADDRKVRLPFLNVFDLEGDKIRSYTIYIDPTPLAAE